ncbi:MAG: flagellar motor switch protein FliN [Robiginitomaculum sp.]|nr:MAG: flagellar motor switch protein FliN [Robiginitomaculum sp.]
MAKPAKDKPVATPKKAQAAVQERRDMDGANQYKRSIYALSVNVQVVIGTANPTIGELLQMKRDSLITLDCKLEDPVDLVINNRVIARGELIETDPATGEIGVQLTEIVDVTEDMLQ